MARIGKTVARLALVGVAGWVVWSVLGWYGAPRQDDLKGPCGNGEQVSCAICSIVGRSDCHVKPLTGCPATAVEYVASFPKFSAKLKEQKAAASRWTGFRKEMEAIQNRSAIELCRGSLDQMKKVEAEIPLTGACPGGNEGKSGEKVAPSDEVAQLMRFRDCSDVKAKELGAAAKKRDASKVGQETAQLHSMIKEITKVTTDSIELVTQFREQSNEILQTKCWLRGRINDCGR